MSGVGQYHDSARFQVRAEAGGEAANVASMQHEVQVSEKFSGRILVAALGRADQEGCGHGRGGAFAADVADEHTLAAVGQSAAEVEVATDVAHGAEGDFNARAFGCIDGGGSEDPLDLLGGLHLAGEGGALLGGAAVFAKEQ